jgi:uncharacterized protein YqjF (DUF2071 family)
MPAAALQPLVPPELKIQEFEGTSWVGLVPFRMEGVTHRGLPDIPGVSAFPELNLRLYVEYQGRPGVWFVSLDATQPLAIWAAKRFFHLPYFRADMSLARSGEEITYRSQRRDSSAALQVKYRPTSPPRQTQPGSLEHWLTERYCLFARSKAGALYRCDIHHAPWLLQDATAEFELETMGSSQGTPLSGPPSLLHFSRSIDVVVWSPKRLSD